MLITANETENYEDPCYILQLVQVDLPYLTSKTETRLVSGN